MPALTENPDGTPHIHEFARRKDAQGKPSKYYQCRDPHCFAEYHKQKLKGKKSICAVCHKKELILDYEQLRRAEPRCLDCSQTKQAVSLKDKKDVLQSLGIR